MNQALYVHINMFNGEPFTATVASLVGYGKPIADRRAEALKGEYRLRIRWYESATPQRQRQKMFKHSVR